MGSDESALPYMIPHAIGAVGGAVTLICSIIAYSTLDTAWKPLVAFIMAFSALVALYCISAFIEDFKRTDFAWKRAHLSFLYVDLFLLVSILPIAIAGASKWMDQSKDGARSYNAAVVCFWLTWMTLGVITVQDHVSAQRDES